MTYQDASTMDLKLATRTSGVWAAEVLLEDGAHGFYTDLDVVGDVAYVVSVVARLDGRGIESSRLGLTLRNLP